MSTPSRPTTLRVSLAVLAGLDAAIQGAVLWLPAAFSGIGLVGFALLPLALAWYLFLLVTIVAGLPLAYRCFRQRWLAPLGAALLVLTALNVLQAGRWYAAQQPTPAEREERSAESRQADEVYRCITQWFAVPRRAVDVHDSELVFAGGVHIDVCRLGNRLCGGDPASVARREAFGRFAKEHVLGQDLSVTLPPRAFFRYEGGTWCANGSAPEQSTSASPGRYPADVRLRGQRLTVTESPPRIDDFP